MATETRIQQTARKEIYQRRAKTRLTDAGAACWGGGKVVHAVALSGHLEGAAL